MEPRRSHGGTQPDRGDAARGDAPARVDDAGDDAAEAEQADDSAPLQWSRAMVDAVRRVDQFVVRYLDVARCGVWTVSDDGERAICVDQFVRDGHVHRRDPDRDGPNAAALHRRLQSAGWLSAGADAPNAALLPPGASAVLAVSVRRGGQHVAAYLCAEQSGTARPWSTDEQRFLRSMGDVLREVFAVSDAAAARIHEGTLSERLSVVTYRGTRIGGAWTLMMVGEAAERLLGRRAASLIGEPVHALRELLADVPPSLPSAGAFEHGYRRQGGDVQRRFVEKGHVGRDPTSGAPVVEGLIVEITASVDAGSDALAHARLLTQVGHELRTPLNAMLGFAQLIELDPEGSAAQRHEYVTQIRRAGHHLLEVVRDMMDLTRLESGQVELRLEPIALAQLVEDCLSMVAHQAARAGVQLVNSVRDTRLQVVADTRSLSQALVNLLSNAVKYNRAGGRVVIECDAGGERAKLRVTDTGIGLSAEETRALFQPFNRLGRERTGVEGVGLGLVITRRLVRAMGGDIAVTSEPGVGSTFELLLPRPR
jgi:signal transduction histidine kinase